MSTTKKFVTVAAVAFAFAFAAVASAATWDFGSATIKKGSSGMYAKNVQEALNACSNAGLTVDGKFGSMSAAAAMAFQQSKGLMADGKVGAATKAALNNCGSSSSSSSTSVSCPVGYTCVSNGTSSTPSTSGPFSINNVNPLSGYLSTQVGVGQQDKKIGDLRIITAAGGSANLSGVNVSFYNRGTGDYMFTKYASSVSVWLNGVKVGSVPASAFSQYNSQYSAFIPTSGAVLNSNTTNDLAIAVSALPVIDSANLGSGANTFAFEVTALRYSDSTGSFQYTIPSSSNFDGGNLVSGTLQSSAIFSAASSAQSIKLTVTKDPNDANDRVLQMSASAQTQGQTLATINFQAQGSNVMVNKFNIQIASNTNPAYVLNTVRLYNGTTLLDTETVPAGSGSQTVTFQNLNLNIPVNTTLALTVKGDFNSVDGTNFTAGSYVRINVPALSTSGNIQAYDQNSNLLSGANVLIGSTTGNKVYGYVNGINVISNGVPSYTTPSGAGGSSHTVSTLSIPFSVTAFGTTAYVPNTASLVSGAVASVDATATGTKVLFGVDAGGAYLSTATIGSASGTITFEGGSVGSSLTPDSNGNYIIPAGQTANFKLSVLVSPTANGTGQYRASLVDVPWSNISATSRTGDPATGYTEYYAGLTSSIYKTPYVALQ